MTDDRPVTALIAAAGGVLVIVSLFLPWAGDTSGWELLAGTDVFLLAVGAIGVLTGVTGGRIGLFRPDVSLVGAADVLGVVATVVLAWLALGDFPEGASREIGLWLGLLGAFTQMMAAGDYSVLRGAPAFPRLTKPGS